MEEGSGVIGRGYGYLGGFTCFLFLGSWDCWAVWLGFLRDIGVLGFGVKVY